MYRWNDCESETKKIKELNKIGEKRHAVSLAGNTAPNRHQRWYVWSTSSYSLFHSVTTG